MHQTLLISTGLAPQVVTEMLWWFVAREGPPRIVPDSIHIVTTGKGAAAVREGPVASSPNSAWSSICPISMPA